MLSTEPDSRRSSGGVYLRLKLSAKSGSRRSPDEVCLQPLESRTKPGSRRNPGGVFLQLKSKVKSGSRRSPDKAYRQLMLRTKPDSRRSSDGVPLVVGVVGGARLPWESGRSPPEVDVTIEARFP